MLHLSMLRFLALSGLALSTLACQPKEEAPKAQTSYQSEEASGVGEAGIDYPALYCANVGQIKLRTSITEELDLVCKGGAPTPLLLSLREEALKQEPGKISIRFMRNNTVEKSDRSDFLLVWVFRAPVRPFEVKGRPLYDFIAQGHQSDKVSAVVKASRLPDEQVDHGLHLWTVDMAYNLAVKALPSLQLTNERRTQYNLYQVQSGNEEMGLGVEHLVQSLPQEIYQTTNLVNISFNDGGGYNDGKGGTVVINFLKFDFNNQGFPETAESTIHEIASRFAQNMYLGLK